LSNVKASLVLAMRASLRLPEPAKMAQGSRFAEPAIELDTPPSLVALTASERAAALAKLAAEEPDPAAELAALLAAGARRCR
jgi:hypothetical protein